jgi:hypothetical protein
MQTKTHAVTDAERRQARLVVGGDLTALTVAFGRRMAAEDGPGGGAAWRERVPERSVLESELAEVRACSLMHVSLRMIVLLHPELDCARIVSAVSAASSALVPDA